MLMEKEMMTRKNPNGSYRIPLSKMGDLRIDGQSTAPAMFGAVADKLGWYENCGMTQEEIENYVRKRAKK